MTEINVALIGHQFMGKAHSNAYRQVSKFFPGKLEPRLKVICGKASKEELEATARQFGWEESDPDWRRVVERKDIDVVDISTPGFLHHPMAIAAAEAGKHLICEKPLANTLAEAKEMLRAVEKAGVKHYVTFNYRRVPAVALAKQLVADGRLGEIYHYHGAYLQDWIMDPQFPLVWRLEKKYAGSGALGDIGAHAADLAQFLNADITEVVGFMTTFIKERPLVDAGPGAWGAKGGRGKGKVTVDDERRRVRKPALCRRPPELQHLADLRQQGQPGLEFRAHERAGILRSHRGWGGAGLQDHSRHRGCPSLCGRLVAARAYRRLRAYLRPRHPRFPDVPGKRPHAHPELPRWGEGAGRAGRGGTLSEIKKVGEGEGKLTVHS
jgi:predicted dehydrogenase